jgi:hypothetical protein
VHCFPFAKKVYKFNFVLLMKLVTLQFPSILELIDFSLIIEGTMFEADRRQNTLTCELSVGDIELAKASYKALVVSTTDPLRN